MVAKVFPSSFVLPHHWALSSACLPQGIKNPAQLVEQEFPTLVSRSPWPAFSKSSVKLVYQEYFYLWSSLNNFFLNLLTLLLCSLALNPQLTLLCLELSPLFFISIFLTPIILAENEVFLAILLSVRIIFSLTWAVAFWQLFHLLLLFHSLPWKWRESNKSNHEI